MVAVRNHRIGLGALAESPPRPGVGRVDVEIVADEGTAQPVRMHRIGVSVFAKSPAQVAPQRVSTEILAEEGGAQQVRLHAIKAGSLAKSLPRIGVQRQTWEAAANEGTAQPVRVHRISYSILARGALPPPEPLPLASDLHFFMHNWVEKVVIETSYQTDVFRSPSTGAEERTSRTQRPDRLMELSWLRDGEDEIRELLRLLRRLTDENLQVPIYPDAVEVTSALTTNDSTISCNTRNRRYFVGARVLLFPKTLTHVTAAQAMIRTIESLTASSLTFTAIHGTTAAANTLAVVPLMDCEIVLEPEVRMQTDLVGEVRMTVREVHSKNALPPLAIGQPDGAVVRNGYPVFEFGPDWSEGLTTTYLRYGTEAREGLRNVPSVEGERFVLKTEWNLQPLDRDEFNFVAGFFDTRRGRGRAFYVIDRHDLFTPISNLTNAVFVQPKGTFAEFEQYWTEDHCGVGFVLEDGSIYIARVFSVTDNGSTWVLSLDLGQTLPILDMTQVSRFGRARLSRFSADVLRETWHTTDVCEVTLSTIEVPNEKQVDFQ